MQRIGNEARRNCTRIELPLCADVEVAAAKRDQHAECGHE